MNFLQIVGLVIFIGAGFTATVSWIVGVYEMFSAYRLTGKLFYLGPVLLRRVTQVPSAQQSIPQGETIKLATYQLRFMDSHSGIFGPCFSFFGLGLSSHIPIKGTFSLNTPDITIEVRMLLGTAYFFCAWLVGWTTAGVIIGLSPDFDLLNALSFTLFGWVFVLAIYFVTLRISRHASERAVAEVLDYLSHGSAIGGK